VIALLQRCNHARVIVDGRTIGAIDRGLLVFLCAEPDDQETSADRLLERILNYRIFPDEEGRMNRSVRDIAGGVLLVPQFTLAADTNKGNRPGFSRAAPPAFGERMFGYAWQTLNALHPRSACGQFGADMQVQLENDGPATFWLQQA
jgi:D-tyrosyl-tRNA(Tyr) deacylase